MTISTTESRISYNGNGATTVFSFPYRFLANGDLVVVEVAADGTETVKTITTHYTITGAGDDAGGSVTMLVAPASGTRLVIYRDTEVVQETDYISGDPFPAETHERALDRLTMIAQEIAPNLARSITLPVGDASGLNDTLPAAANRLDKFIVFDATTGATELSTVTQTQVASAVAAAYAAGSTADAVTYLPEGTGAVSRSVQSRMREAYSVTDFGATGDGSTDDTAEIQAAIDAVRAAGGGALLFPAGTYKISATLTTCDSVYLIGEGAGRWYQPTEAPATKIAWYGGASNMLQFGHGVSTQVNGGVARMCVDGRGIATRCLSIKDFQHGQFDDIQLTGAITAALELSNTDTYDVTGFCTFRDMQINLRGGATDSAHGIYLNGVGTGASGVTKNHFFAPRIEHANGHGLILGLRADSNTFVDFFAYRANTTETGYGVRFESTSTGAVNTTNKFIGSTVAVGGVSIAVPSATTAAIGSEGAQFVSVNTTELASDLTDRFNPFRGAGKVFGHGATDKRYRTGFNRLMHEYQGHSFDDFRFVAYAHPLLSTNSGAWFTVRNGGGGSVASAVQPGGAVDLITGTGGTDDIAIYSAADFTSGITYTSNPVMTFTAAPASVATVRDQWGMFGDATLPDPTNGIYVQFDPAVNANYQLVSRKAGTSTTITTSIAGAATKRMWMIALDDTQNVLWFTRLATETQWTYLGVSATNVPIVAMLAGFRCRAQAAANRDCHVYSCEFGHYHE